MIPDAILYGLFGLLWYLIGYYFGNKRRAYQTHTGSYLIDGETVKIAG